MVNKVQVDNKKMASRGAQQDGTSKLCQEELLVSLQLTWGEHEWDSSSSAEQLNEASGT